jgi:hypothetical protein
MNKLIATAASVLLVNLSALAQGTILLENIGNGFTKSGVRGPDGTLIPAGSSQYTIELLAGTTAGSVAPFATPITTTTWAGGGYFGVGDPERVLPGFAPGSFPFLQLRAWINTGGVNSYAGALAANQAGLPSPVFQLIPGPGLNGLGNQAILGVPAPPLFGMPTGYSPFAAVPEPSTVVLGVLGGVALLLRRSPASLSRSKPCVPR